MHGVEPTNGAASRAVRFVGQYVERLLQVLSQSASWLAWRCPGRKCLENVERLLCGDIPGEPPGIFKPCLAVAVSKVRRSHDPEDRAGYFLGRGRRNGDCGVAGDLENGRYVARNHRDAGRHGLEDRQAEAFVKAWIDKGERAGGQSRQMFFGERIQAAGCEGRLPARPDRRCACDPGCQSRRARHRPEHAPQWRSRLPRSGGGSCVGPMSPEPGRSAVSVRPSCALSRCKHRSDRGETFRSRRSARR